jgi:hypothetical protein
MHFRSSANFTRPLLDYDDTEFIAPLDGMRVSTYFGQWARAPDHYVFPLRDLTFAVDFWLSRTLHVQTFWLVNFALFLATLLALGRCFALYYPARPGLLAGAMGLVALHPLNVHMVEWLSNRKHLLVVLILAWATAKALKQEAERAAPAARDWVIYFAAYVLAWLCFPTGMLWILWLLWLFRAQLRAAKGRAVVVGLAALAIVAAGYCITVAGNTSYQSKAGVETSPLRFAVASTGRAVFNLLVPLELHPYYRLGDAREWIGLGMLVVLVGLAGYRLYRLSPERRRRFAHLVLLAVALYLPHAKVFLGYSEYVWSDRYLYGSLPFLVLAALVLLVESGARAADRGGVRRRLGTAAVVFVAGAYLVLGWQTVPRWQNGRVLFETCAREEQSAKCVAMAVEKNFDQGGCVLLPELFELAHQIAPQARLPADHSFQAEVPVYDALCIAAELAPPADKLRRIEELRQRYTAPDFLMLGQILVHLQRRDIAAALGVARATYFNPSLPMPNASTKIINMMRGQGEALCQLAELLAHDRSCWDSLARFRARVPTVVLKPKQVEWTFNRTLQAFNTGQ